MDLQDQKEAYHQRRKAKKAECARRRRARMSDKDKAKHNEYQRKRRAKMAEKEVKKRRIKNVEAHRKRRANMTEEELKKERIKNLENQRRRRAKMTEEELKHLRIKDTESRRKRIAKMDEEERNKLRIKNAECMRKRITKMNEEELKELRIKDADCHRKRLAKMDEEELKELRIKDADCHRKRIAKMDEEERNKLRIKNSESMSKRIAKMNEEEPAVRPTISQWRASQAAYQRRYRQQLKDESMKLLPEVGLHRLNIFLRRFTKSKSIKYARNFFSKIIGEIGNLQEEIGSLKKQLKQSVSDAVQNAVKVHRIKKQTSGRCQSFTFVEIQMPVEPNKIIKHQFNRADNEIDPLIHKPGGGDNLDVCFPNGNVEFADKMDQNDETFVVRPYDERIICEEMSEVNEENKLECLVCTKKFSTSLGLTIHQKEHGNHTKEFKCSVCPEFFKSYNLMTNHYLQVHSSFEDVDKEVQSSEQIDEELERGVHHSEFLVAKKCSICLKTFDKERVGLTTYGQHIISNHSDNQELLKYFTYICSRCDKPHTFIHHLETHWKTNCFEKWKNEDGNNKQRVCETCGIKFSNENSLSSHVKIFHSEKRKSVCEQCGKVFGSEHTLKQHTSVTHGGEYKFNCEQCEKKFKTQTSLKSHIKTVHLKVKPFVCKFCSKSFSNSSCLSTHLNTHTGEKPYKCNYCDKSFAAAPSLYVHEGYHTGFTCKICNQSFKNYIELRGHRSQYHPNPNAADQGKVGSDEAVENQRELKPTCKVCGKTFKTYTSMYGHRRAVHDGRKYICDVCGKICTSRSSFNYHKYTHDNRSKRFGCNLCGKQFGQCTNFYQHRKVAHANQNAQIVKLTTETSFSSTEKVDKSTRGSIPNKERMLPELTPDQFSNAVQTSIEPSEIETNPSLQCTEESNQLQLDYNPDNSQGSENYSSDMDFVDQDNENDITSLPQFDIAELRSVNPENATSVSDDVHNSCGSKLPTCKEATSGDQSVPSSINFNDFSSSNIPLGLDTFSVDEVQPEIINTNIVSDETVDKNEKQHQVFIEDSEANGFLADFSVDELMKLKTEATLSGVYDDDQSISSIQPYFSDAGGDDETAIEESNGNRKSWRNAEKIVSSPFEDNSPRLVVKLTRLLEYKCAPCDKTIFAISGREIRHHSRAHRATNIRPKKKKRTPSERGGNIKCDFDCLYCEKKKLSSIQMIAHCSKEHPWQQPFQCNMCPKMFHNDDTLRRHKPQHNNDNYAGDPNVKPFWCELCLKEFKTVEDAKEHFEHFHQNKMFQCDICLFSCVKKTQLKNHKLRHSGIKSHVCDECEKAFFTKHELTDHVERVHKKIQKRKSRKPLKGKAAIIKEIFNCLYCEKKNLHSTDMIAHCSKEHPGQEPLKCKVCSKMFCTNKSFLSHKYHTHSNANSDPNAKKEILCELCGKEFMSHGDVKRHFRKIHQDKKFQCDICSYSCVRKDQLKIHKVRHSGIKPHLCDECGKAFFTPHELTDHVERVHKKIEKRKSRKHLKEKSSDTHPFTCHLCPYVFRKENGLKMHLKLHDPKRKNVCDECGLRFVFNANLLDHKLSKHTKNGTKNLKVVLKDA